MSDRLRALIVASTYSPAILADTHRARMLAWDLPELGWDVEVLCPDADFQPTDSIDANANSLFADDVPVHRVGERVAWLFRVSKVRTIGWRSWWPLYRAGLSLLESGRFDVVLFTTTQFNLFLLGRLWRRRTRVPYVLDFQDPWRRSDAGGDTRYQTSSHPWKMRLARALATRMEPVAVARAAGVIAVSPEYLDALTKRYADLAPPWLDAQRHAVIPFAATERDVCNSTHDGRRPAPPSSHESLRLVYVGAGGEIMRKAFVVFCGAFRRLSEAGNIVAARTRVQLYGTDGSWTPQSKGVPYLQQVANDFGLASCVNEHPARVTYRQSLDLLAGAHGVLVFGVDEAGYMPSKLFSYALSGKPLLASLRVESPAWNVLRHQPGIGRTLSFGGDRASTSDETDETLSAYLDDVACGYRCDRRELLEPYLAPAMARHVASVLSAACS